MWQERYVRKYIYLRPSFNLLRRLLFIPFLWIGLVSLNARAELTVLPDSRHQLFQTFGLFIDEQSSLIYLSGGRAWGGLGGTLGLLGIDSLPFHPQLIAHGSSQAAFRFNQRVDTLLTETVDARVGLALDLELGDELRASLKWTHYSGHISDNVPDPELIGSNLGDESLGIRIVKDCKGHARMGGTLRPFVGSEPGLKAFAADQFIEWWWGGTNGDGKADETLLAHHFTPYLAAGLEEYGREKVELSEHIQGGFFVGSHLSGVKRPSLRVTLGYYSGIDPRLKYFQFKNSKSNFAYLGVMFDL